MGKQMGGRTANVTKAPEPPGRVADVFKDLARHPVRYLILRWNWKTAAGTEGLRGTIFFFTSLPDGLTTALMSLGRDALFRVPLGGAYGSLTQAFRNAEPQWAAMTTVFVLLPAISHVIEYLVHSVGGTPRLELAILISISFSGLSAVFNLYAMRQGALVVEEGNPQSFRDDVKRLPRIYYEFGKTIAKLVAGAARDLWAWIRRR
jgi:hypothetical protein